MVSNYRKSPGRFGEINDEAGIERPPVRPSIAFPNARNVLLIHGTASAAPSMEKSDSTPTTALYLSTTDADDMSSLGDDPSILEILFPASPVKVATCDEEPLPNSQTPTSRTMSTLMDLFHPAESPSRQELQWNTVAIDQGAHNSELLSDVVEKKRKKKKKRTDENDAEKTKDATEKKKKKKKKAKGEKQKTKVSKSRDDTTCTKAKKNESLDRKKKKSSLSEPSSPPGIPSSNEPTKKEKKKRRKSEDTSPPELNVDKRHERKQKKSSKGEAVVPSSTHQEQKSKLSTSKEKTICREKSSSHNGNSPNFSPTKKDNNGHKSYKRKDASDDGKSRALFTSTAPNSSTSPPPCDSSVLGPQDEKADDYSFDERSFFSCARSTFTFDCFDLPDSTKKYCPDNRPDAPTDIGRSSDIPSRTLEFAIASAPKERATERQPTNATKKSKGLFLKRFFGESHSTQGWQ